MSNEIITQSTTSLTVRDLAPMAWLTSKGIAKNAYSATGQVSAPKAVRSADAASHDVTLMINGRFTAFLKDTLSIMSGKDIAGLIKLGVGVPQTTKDDKAQAVDFMKGVVEMWAPSKGAKAARVAVMNLYLATEAARVAAKPKLTVDAA